MTQVPANTQFKQVSDTTEQANWTSLLRLYQTIARIINGGLGFGSGASATSTDNINNAWANVTTPAVPNTDFVVTHNLGRAVAGYWLALKDRGVDIYTSPTANADPQHTFIFRATVASAVVRIILI